ncbi:MAG: YfhO family protein [Chloroflexi bacterium]|nr:YfhO family protein [Chloroflexota bacterium]
MLLPGGWLLGLFGLWLVAYAVACWLHRRGRLAKDYHRDVLALGIIALATLGFFWRLFFTTDTWMPAGGGDLVSFLYPLYHFAARNLRRGIVPLWNPYLYGGAPFAADNQSGLFYPVNLLFFLLFPEITYPRMELMAVFHFFLAGVFMYTCLRNLRTYESTNLRRSAALAGAIAFMFSDLFITHFGNLNMIAVAAWLPLIFLCYQRALTEQRPGKVVTAGSLLGMATLAGHIQITLFIALALALYTLYQRGRLLLHSLTRYLLPCYLIAFCFAALALIPSYEMAGHTVRAELSYQEASRYSLPPVGLVGLLIPGFFGRGPAGFWGPWDRVEVGYIGVLPLILAALAVLFRRDRLTRFLLGLAIISLLLAFGGHAILHGWLYLLPGFDKVRAPARFIYLFDFSVATLAALGLDALLRPLSHGMRVVFRRLLKAAPWVWSGIAVIGLSLGYHAILTAQGKDVMIYKRTVGAVNGLVFFLLILAASLAILYLRRYRWGQRAVGGLAVGLIALDLFSMGAYIDLEHNDPTVGFQHPEAIEFLKSDPGYYRIDTGTGVWDVWQPNASLLYGLFDVSGIWNPLQLADYKRYWDAVGLRGLRSSRLYDFVNAKYVIGHKDVPLDWDKFVPVFDGDPQVNIYLNTRALPRAILVHQAIVVPDQEGAFVAIQDPDFDPASSVIVEGGKALQGSRGAGERGSGGAEEQGSRGAGEQGSKGVGEQGSSESLDITVYRPSSIHLTANTLTEAYLVLSEVYYPGWRAYVDGRAAPVLRANYAFRAAYLEPGYHEVRLVFEPLSWKVGLGISVATWVGLAVWALFTCGGCGCCVWGGGRR